LARIAHGLQDKIYLGNLDARRDWGHARDYVEMQWLMLQQEEPKDYVIATGYQRSVREFVDAAAGELGIRLRWQGEGVQEKGIVDGIDTPQKNIAQGDVLIEVDPVYFRPAEVETLLGDPGKAKRELGWSPQVKFESLVSEMMKADNELVRKEALLGVARGD
jgi:GDPmannose 4,6-dehydratase